VTTAVGKAALSFIAPTIAAGLRRRNKNDLTVMVVACENVLGNSTYLKERVREVAGSNAFADVAVFPDCVVDRIVPNTTARSDRHPLAVTVEDYAQWVIDAEGLPFHPEIQGAEFRSGLAAVLGQKLFTLNMAHAIVGYYGHLRGLSYVHEAMRDEHIRLLLDGALSEAEHALCKLYGIHQDAQRHYAARILTRLENPALQDEIVRVSRDPMRKLGVQDRLIRPALAASETGSIPIHLATGVAAALLYDATSDKEATALTALVREHGIKRALATVSGVPENHVLSELVHANAHFRAL